MIRFKKAVRLFSLLMISCCIAQSASAYYSDEDYQQNDRYQNNGNQQDNRYQQNNNRYRNSQNQPTYYRYYRNGDQSNYQDQQNMPGYMRNADRAVFLANTSLPTQAFIRWIKAEMQKSQIPTVSIAVIKDYKVEWAMAFGVTDIMAETPATDMTLFQAGSISKPVVAMAALKAVQQGKLSLDGDINNYLTSWKLPTTSLDKVTLARLLSHSAGINVTGFVGYSAGDQIPTLIEILNGKAPANSDAIAVSSTPGESFEYSGGGYTIIQQAMMDVYHQPFPQIMDKLVLSQLGMSHSTYEQPLPEYLADSIAKPYHPKFESVPGGAHIYPEQAAAGLWTTPFDLAKFIISIQSSLSGDPRQILTRDYAKLMVKPEIDHMGLGFFVNVDKYGQQVRQGNYFMHGGQNDGYRSLLIASVTGGNGIIIMTNMAPDSKLVLTNKIKDSWAFIYAVQKKVADMENW